MAAEALRRGPDFPDFFTDPFLYLPNISSIYGITLTNQTSDLVEMNKIKCDLMDTSVTTIHAMS